MCKHLSGQKKLGQQNRQIKLPQNHGRRWILMPGYSLTQMPWDCPGIKLEAATDKPNNWEFLIFQRPWPRNWLLDQQNKNFRFDCCIKSISQVFVDRNRFGVTSSGSATTQTFQFSNGSMEHWSELVDSLSLVDIGFCKAIELSHHPWEWSAQRSRRWILLVPCNLLMNCTWTPRLQSFGRFFSAQFQQKPFGRDTQWSSNIISISPEKAIQDKKWIW